jgi:purine-binding chemotaxis protein CheW
LANDSGQYIEVGLNKERFAIHISDIHEIIRMQDITTVPNVRAHVQGVINLRGIVVPVFSLRSRLNMVESTATASSRIVVVRHGEEKIGLLVDQASHVITLEEIQPVPETLGGLNTAFFSGIGHSDAGLVSVLNLEEVLGE